MADAPVPARSPPLGVVALPAIVTGMPQSLVDLAQHYHTTLNDRIRAYLHARGLTDEVIDHFLLGWSGWRITIPITNRDGDVVSFKLAKDPDDDADTPKMLTTPGAAAELYGWEWLRTPPPRLVICEGEFDRLVLESRGMPAVTSTAGAGTFRLEWAEALRAVRELFICFDRDEAGEQGAARVARLLPQARVVRLPVDVGPGGDVSDYFVRLGQTVDDFERLLADSQPLRFPTERTAPSSVAAADSPWPRAELEDLKRRVALQDLVRRYTPLQPRGRHFVGRCPFHDDRQPSFVVYAEEQRFHCFGCAAHGDVLAFLMRVESLRFPEAVQALQRLAA